MTPVLDVATLSERLIAYLRDKLANATLDYARPLAQLHGGYQTSIYRFRLDGLSGPLSGPLVLRLYPPPYGAGHAIWESTVQDALAGEGYPAARVHDVCTDLSILGSAFYIMDCLTGRPLATAAPETVARLLGEAHARLHAIDADPLLDTLRARGLQDDAWRLGSRFDWLRDQAGRQPWLSEAVDWLREHRPPDPEHLCACHGDFHPLNVLWADGVVTGILDWGGFAIADPAYDVGNTVVLITMALKHLAASMDVLPSADFGLLAERYLAAYRACRALDDSHLEYYQVRRCVMALAEGADGQDVWQHPGIVRDLLAHVHGVAGIRVSMPA